MGDLTILRRKNFFVFWFPSIYESEGLNPAYNSRGTTIVLPFVRSIEKQTDPYERKNNT